MHKGVAVARTELSDEPRLANTGRYLFPLCATRSWQDSIGGSASGQPGQLPPYQSIYAKWQKDTPDWLKAQTWVPLVFGQLQVAKAIPNHAYGLQQFIIGQPLWEKYLKGDEKDPMVAMKAAKDAVAAEVLKNQ